jgi:hypothetical protein
VTLNDDNDNDGAQQLQPDPTAPKGAALNPELQRLELEAAGGPRVAGEGEDQGEPAGELVIPNAEVIKGALITLRDAFCLFTGMTSPKQVTNDDAGQLADAWAKVADHYGLKLGEMAGAHGMLIGGAVMATFALASRVGPAIRDEFNERRAKERATVNAGRLQAPPAPPAPIATPAPMRDGFIPAFGTTAPA